MPSCKEINGGVTYAALPPGSYTKLRKSAAFHLPLLPLLPEATREDSVKAEFFHCYAEITHPPIYQYNQHTPISNIPITKSNYRRKLGMYKMVLNSLLRRFNFK